MIWREKNKANEEMYEEYCQRIYEELDMNEDECFSRETTFDYAYSYIKPKYPQLDEKVFEDIVEDWCIHMNYFYEEEG